MGFWRSQVQFLSPRPSKCDPNLSPIGDAFGSFVYTVDSHRCNRKESLHKSILIMYQKQTFIITGISTGLIFNISGISV